MPHTKSAAKRQRQSEKRRKRNRQVAKAIKVKRKAVAEGLTALGGDLTATADGWIVRGGTQLPAARVRSYGDHRLAMLFALADSAGDGAEIDGAAAVDVSYPGFWATLAELTA